MYSGCITQTSTEDFLSEYSHICTKLNGFLREKFMNGQQLGPLSRSCFSPDGLSTDFPLLFLQVSMDGGASQHFHPQIPDVDSDITQAPLPGRIHPYGFSTLAEVAETSFSFGCCAVATYFFHSLLFTFSDIRCSS